jgi:hypothetical protein
VLLVLLVLLVLPVMVLLLPVVVATATAMFHFFSLYFGGQLLFCAPVYLLSYSNQCS